MNSGWEMIHAGFHFFVDVKVEGLQEGRLNRE